MLEALLAGLAGLLIGSFLNVCIHRMPRDLSVVRPRSFCPSCEHTISWYDNIPLISYLVLGGRCRRCGARISWRYPAVEAATGILFLLFVLRLGPNLGALKFCLFSALLIGLFFADLEERILPDEFTLGGLMAGLGLAFVVPVNDVVAHALLYLAGFEWNPRVVSAAEATLGALLPSMSLWLGGLVFEKLRHKEGLGLGDVKMMAMVGAFLGLREALLALIAGSLLGSLIGLAFILIARKDASTYPLPFGSFIAAAALAVALFGEKVVAWYAALG